MRKFLLRLNILIWGIVFVAYLMPVNNAQATAQVNSGIGVQYGNVGIATFTANPGTYAVIYTAPSSGNNFAKLIGLTASNADTSTAHLVTCKIIGSATATSNITGIVIPTSAAIAAQSGSIPPVNMLSNTLTGGLPVDQWGNPFVYIPSGGSVACTYTTALTNGYVGVEAQAGEF
jgi:hypothetical protein